MASLSRGGARSPVCFINNPSFSPLGLSSATTPYNVDSVRPSLKGWQPTAKRSRFQYQSPVPHQNTSLQSVRAHLESDTDGDSETTSDGDRGDDDRTASDLSLPDLQKLFYEGGDPNCDHCKGAGVITCPVCEGKGYYSVTLMDITSSSTCRMCRGRRVIPCPTCREMVFKSIMWWDQIPSEDEDPDENWRTGPDGMPRIPWGEPPTEV